MNEKLDRGRQQSVVVPEYFAKILKNKDRIIRVQAKRIEMLEGEVHRLRLSRESMSSQLAVLSYKLQAVSVARNSTVTTNQRNKNEGVGETSKTQTAPSVVDDVTPKNPNSLDRPKNGNEPRRSPAEQPQGRMVTSGDNKLVDPIDPFFALTEEEQLKLLEENYGGYARANRAALKIQHMFRQFSLNRNFEKLRLEAGDSSRRSRRFNKLIAESCQKGTSTDSFLSAVEENEVNSTSGFAHQTCIDGKEEFQREDCQNGNHTSSSSVRDSNDRKNRLFHLDKPSRLHLDRRRVGSAKSHSEEREREPQRLHDGSEGNSPSVSPTPMVVDLPSFNFESLLENRQRRAAGDCSHDDVMLERGWSSSSSSSKVSTPVEPLSILTYIDEDCIKTPDEIGDCTLVFTGKTTNNCDLESPCRTLTSNASCDYDNVFLSIPTNTNSSEMDGNCLRIGQRYTKPSFMQSTSLGKSPCTGNLYARRGPKEHSHACRHHLPGLPSDARPYLIHLDSETHEPSPVWKRKSSHESNSGMVCGHVRQSSEPIEEERNDVAGNSSVEPVYSSSSSDVASLGSNNDIKMPSTYGAEVSSSDCELYVLRNRSHLSDKQKKRLYRIGLNLFNRKPEKGIQFLMDNHFLDNKPRDVARFLLTRKGLSKQMIGEYLGNLLRQFNMDVLEHFVNEMDLTGLSIDKALRKFQSHFRMPGEAQKIEKLMEAFASIYISCNPDVGRKFVHPDTVFLIAYSIIMLNTDLHNNNIKPDRKMKLQDFLRNLRGIDGGDDVDTEMLTGIFDRIETYPLKPANDHVMQVMKVEKMILGKKPQLAVPHRRLICYCRLFEVKDPNKREKSNMHQREVFLFNDLLLVTKLNNKKKDSLLYNYRESFPLFGMKMTVFELPYYKHGVQLTTNLDNRVLITFCASNEADRMKFVEDLNEAIMEVNEMEAMRVKEELANQNKAYRNCPDFHRRSKDSGIVDLDPGRLAAGIVENRLSAPECPALNKSSLSSSMSDMIDGRHRLSSGSLDSGLPSVNSGSSSSFQDKSIPKATQENAKFNIFARKPKLSKSSPMDAS